MVNTKHDHNKVEAVLLPKSTLEILGLFTGSQVSERIRLIVVLIRAGAGSYAHKLQFFRPIPAVL